MEFIKCIKVLFQKALTLGTPSEEKVLYAKVIQKEAPKKSTKKHRLQAAIETIGNALKNTMSIAEHEEGVEFSRGTATPPPKMATKPKSVTKKSAAKEPNVKKSETKTAIKKTTEKKTVSVKKATPEKKKVVTAIKSATTKKKDSAKTVKTKTTGKTESKKSTAKKTSAKPATTKKAEKIALYAKDIQKHYGEVDNEFLAIIVKNLGPSIYKKDTELVSCSDPKVLNSVRKNFLMKKLGIDASQKVLDAAIEDVCEELKATRTKYRATFYYSLAKKFKKESVLT